MLSRCPGPRRCTMLPIPTNHTCWSSSLPVRLHGGSAGRQQLLARWSDHRATARRIQTDVRCSGNDQSRCQGDAATRRSVLALAAGCSLLPVGNADASVLPLELRRALQGPANFLRERQRANAGEFILSPIKGSRQKLEVAMKALETQNVYEPDIAIYKNALNIIRSSSMNCYSFQAATGDTLETRASLLQRQLRIGDACTWRLIEKNVVALLPPSQAYLKNQAAGALSDLIKSYEDLDEVLTRAHSGDTFAAEKAFDAMQYTISSAASFQTIIEKCLDLPPALG